LGYGWSPLDAESDDGNVVGLLTDILVRLPMTALVYGMELIVRVVQGMQHATQQGVDVMVGAAPERRGDCEVQKESRDAGFNDVITSSGHAANPEPRPAQKETAAMDMSISHDSRRDRDLHDDMLKLVRYKILFVRREFEVAFAEQEDLVEDNMDGTSFAAWKVAEFIQDLAKQKTDVPRRWERQNYPPKGSDDEKKTYYHDNGTLKALPEYDKRYLRVYYEVLDRYPREKFKHEEQQIEVLREIRDKINK
jgi:hypothetical protein